MFLNRLRVFKVFSSLQIPSPLLLLTTTTPNNNNNTTLSPNRKDLSFFSPPPEGNLHYHPPKKHRALAFSSSTTGAAQAEDETTSSLFSPYLQARIECNRDSVDLLSEALLCFGATSASMDEPDSHEDFKSVWITSIFADGHDIHTCISQAADSIDLNYIPKYEVSRGKQCDWLANIQVSEATNIILDPGLAFGTGDHPTTKMCLLLLHGLIKGGEHFLDYGTGSGVLGIAAVKMGVALSVGVDVDPHAVRSAYQNIALNDIDYNKMAVYLVPSEDHLPNECEGTKRTPEQNTSDNLEHFSKGKFDIVIANILLNPLMDLAEDIVSHGKPGAVIGLSGILSEHVLLLLPCNHIMSQCSLGRQAPLGAPGEPRRDA